MNKRYSYSSDNEVFHGGFATFEEAKAEALAVGAKYVGQCVPPTQPEDWWEASDWLEQVACQDDYAGDHCEDWDGSTKEQRAELEDEVRKVMAAWLDRHDLRPTFFNIVDAVDITIGEAS